MNRWNTFVWNFKQFLICIDQFARVIVALVFGIFNPKVKGYADETISAWSYRCRDRWYGHAMEFFVNCLMYIPEKVFYRLNWGHCKRAYASECNKKQLHPDYQNGNK